MKRYLAVLGIVGMLASVSALADEPATPASSANPATPVAGAADPAAAAPATAAAPAAEHVMYTPNQLKWVDAPPSLPKGAKMAVLSGDPTAPGLFTIRLKVPAGYKVPPHFHPADEHLTVLSGDVNMALGDAWDESKGHSMGVGSFSVMPVGVHHYAWSKKGATFQIHAMGPWGITYLNPADDPRNQKQVTN